MPQINAIGNSLTTYNHSDAEIQNCIDTYPGDYECRRSGAAHAKWHEQNGNALIDMTWLCDDMDRYASTAPSRLHARALTCVV